MPKLVWDRIGARRYENGLDRGVLYLPDGKAVPWNGLTEVSEQADRDASPIYYDGMKIGDAVILGEFQASLKAITYPDEFEAVEGIRQIRGGVVAHNQPTKQFALCYRTMIEDDLGQGCHYKIHIIYNITATPNDKTYASLSDDPEIVEFEWTLTATPEEVPGIRPTAHIVIDTRRIDHWLLEDLELLLYGGTTAEASLMPLPEFIDFLREWYRVKITDNGDGTWTAEEQRPGFITFMDEEEEMFQITKVNAIYLDEQTYVISDTSDASDTPRIVVNDNGDGTWTASTDDDNVIEVNEVDGTFEIHSIDVVFSGPDMFRIESVHSPH